MTNQCRLRIAQVLPTGSGNKQKLLDDKVSLVAAALVPIQGEFVVSDAADRVNAQIGEQNVVSVLSTALFVVLRLDVAGEYASGEVF